MSKISTENNSDKSFISRLSNAIEKMRPRQPFLQFYY